MNCSRVFRFGVLASSLLWTLAGCKESLGPSGARRIHANVSADANCASDSWQSTSGTIGPEGGTLSVPGAQVVIPEWALSRPEVLEFTVGPLAPDTMYVSLQAASTSDVTLDRPATVTLDFSQCVAAPAPAPDTTGVSLDETTGAFSDSTSAPLPDQASSTAEQVIFSIQLLSWYIIAE